MTMLQQVQEAAEKCRREWVVGVCSLVLKRAPTQQELETLGKSAYQHAFANGIKWAVDNGVTRDEQEKLDAAKAKPEAENL